MLHSNALKAESAGRASLCNLLLLRHPPWHPNLVPFKLEIRKSQDLGKDFGGTASKAEKKICKSKNCKLYRNITKQLYLKWKLNERKRKKRRRKEAKRKRFGPESISGPSTHWAKALPLGHVEYTNKVVEILLLKPWSPIKREFKDIFSEEWLQFRQWNPNVDAFHRIYM